MGRLIAFGDIHGCADALETLLEQVCPTSSDELVFVGDYVNRGRDSKRVIDRLIRLPTEGISATFLQGNHESMFKLYLGDPQHDIYPGGALAEDRDIFLRYGKQTLRSYGYEAHSRNVVLPDEHVEFLNSLKTWHFDSERKIFFCHAGFSKRVLESAQSIGEAIESELPANFLWGDNGAICNAVHRLDVLVVYGHYASRGTVIDGRPYTLGIDTGAGKGGSLTAVEFPSFRLYCAPEE